MNRQEHLLTVLMEECAEIQQAVAKSLRFGLEDRKSISTQMNIEDITSELNDLYGIVELINESGVLLVRDENKVKAKKKKVEYFINYAKERGTVSS